MRLYRIHGVLIASEVPFDEPPVECGNPDLVVTLENPSPVPDHAPPGTPLVVARNGESARYFVSRQLGEVIVRVPSMADFELSGDLSHARCIPAPGTSVEALSLLAGGAMMAAWLTLQGHLVLHASAVAWRGKAIAFAGLSGMGKSTCAALGCAAGATLVSDDLLVVETDPIPSVRRGSSRIRLRPSAAEITSLVNADSPRWTTVDGRLALRFPEAEPSVALGCMVIPRPDRSARELAVEHVGPLRSLPMLHACLRINDWIERGVVRRSLDQLSKVVSTVPVYEARIPWGPPFTTGPVVDLFARTLGGPIS